MYNSLENSHTHTHTYTHAYGARCYWGTVEDIGAARGERQRRDRYSTTKSRDEDTYAGFSPFYLAMRAGAGALQLIRRAVSSALVGISIYTGVSLEGIWGGRDGYSGRWKVSAKERSQLRHTHTKAQRRAWQRDRRKKLRWLGQLQGYLRDKWGTGEWVGE